jgi:hypothetical protein
MAEETKVEVIGTEAQEGQGSPYILMMIHKSLANCFRPKFSIGLGREWSNLGLKGLLSKSRKPLVSLIQVDIGGHPPFPAGSKQLSSNFDNLLFLAVF